MPGKDACDIAQELLQALGCGCSNPGPRGTPSRKYPVVWDIRVEFPEVGGPKWESYKRLVDELKRRKLRARGAFGVGFIVIEDVPTQSKVEELTSLVKSYGLEVLDVDAVEQVPEPGDEEE